jgi:NaMN:DMB phosphoribosyltransferase
VQIALIKGLVASSVNLALVLALGASFPGGSTIAAALVIGLGYGLTLVLFVCRCPSVAHAFGADAGMLTSRVRLCRVPPAPI